MNTVAAVAGIELRTATPPRPLAACSGVRAFRRIGEVDAAEWDSIVPPDELQMRHAFVRACEEAEVEQAEYRHLLVYRSGVLVGIASLFTMRVRLELLCPSFLRSVILAGRRIHPGFLRPRLLFCGLPVSAGRPCLAFRAPTDAPYVLAQVSAFMEHAAAELDAALLCFKEFRPAEAALVDVLRQHGYFRAFSLMSFGMTLPWQSFGHYLAAMRAGYRRQTNATLRSSRVAGLRCRVAPGTGTDWDRFFPLYDQVMDRAQFQLERLNQRFFESLARHLPGAIRTITIEQGDEPLAVAVVLETPRLTTFFMTGIDYRRNGAVAAYPRLVTEVVAEAIRAGTGALELGQTSPALKSRLGGLPEPRYLYFRYRSRWAHALFRLTAPVLFPENSALARRVFRA